MASEVGSLVAKGSTTVMGPPPPKHLKRRREQVVLDEDEWTEKIEAIIQRDYFPDLPKLENELEWLEAVRTKDPSVIYQAQANIAKRRAGLRTPMGTPATFATPATGLRTPATQPLVEERTTDPENSAPNMSLDRFMAGHTSEDNASFKEILEGINQRRKARYAWVHGVNKEAEAKLLEDKRPQDGYGSTGQPDAALLTLPTDPKNALYYLQDMVPFTEQELAARAQGPPKEISAANTRLGGPEEDVSLEAAKKMERGDEYAPVATPSMSPGPGATPFITWGELAATPVRLEEDEGCAPRFKVPERKPKDVLAHRLAEGARLNLQKRASLMTPSLLRGMQGKTPRLRSKVHPGNTSVAHQQKVAMSPAAHRLASSLRGKGSTFNQELRASYSRSAQRPRPPTGTPFTATAAQTPAILHPDVEPATLLPARQAVKGASGVAEPDEQRAREAALKSFQQTAARKEALKAFGKITDDLLDL